MKVSRKPSYSLDEMKRLVADNRFRPTQRVERFLISHYDDDPWELAKEIFFSIQEADFVKSFELRGRPGVMADVYVGGCYDNQEWYIKAFIENGELEVQLWSMCWDGCTH